MEALAVNTCVLLAIVSLLLVFRRMLKTELTTNYMFCFLYCGSLLISEL